jgi:hypothetical protein
MACATLPYDGRPLADRNTPFTYFWLRGSPFGRTVHLECRNPLV